MYSGLYFIFIIAVIIFILVIIFFLYKKIENGVNIDLEYDNLYIKNETLVDINNCIEYINFKESLIDHLNYNSKKEIIFFNNVIEKTPYVLYFIHGFNGDKNECKKLLIDISKEFKYNIFLTRLPGHGIYDIETNFNHTFYTYIRSIYEDLIIARLIGEKIIIVGVSTGCTYGIIASIIFKKFNIQEHIMFSPNIEPIGNLSLLTKILSFGIVNFFINFTQNRLYLNDYSVSSNIFIPLIGALSTLRKIKHQFINNCIIFTSKNDDVISNNAIFDFFNNSILSKKKYLYIYKNSNIHPVTNYKNNNFLEKISIFLKDVNNINTVYEII